MVITIDGPAGSGKTTVAKQVADRLGFDLLDTGAMYRALGYEALRREADLDDRRELVFIARHTRMNFDWSENPPELILNGEPMGRRLRSNEVGKAASKVAVLEEVRELLTAEQRQIGSDRPNLVSEGRDQGTVVFPEAARKFFVDADVKIRAQRRWREHVGRGERVTYDEVLDQMQDRDRRDRERAIAPLRPAEDSAVIDTSSLSLEQVVERIVKEVETLRAGVGR